MRCLASGLAVAERCLASGARVVEAVLTSVPFLCHLQRAIEITDAAPYAEVVTFLAVHREAEAAIVATRARSGVTSPLPSGCSRLDKKTTNILVSGSIHSDVPVNPVWP